MNETNETNETTRIPSEISYQGITWTVDAVDAHGWADCYFNGGIEDESKVGEIVRYHCTDGRGVRTTIPACPAVKIVS